MMNIATCPQQLSFNTCSASLSKQVKLCTLSEFEAGGGYCSAMVETHRRQQMELLKKKFGEYGEPFMIGEYKEFKMIFDSGCPAKFWLYANTDALLDLQLYIQVRF